VVRCDLGDRQARVVATPFLDPNRQLSRS
jgi:hypothetical protein